MFWYLRRQGESPSELLREIGEKGIDSFNEKELRALYDQLSLGEGRTAFGRFFYFPNMKEQLFFLQPHMIKGISGGNRSGKSATCVMDVVMQCEGWHPLQKENLEKLCEESIRDDIRQICKEVYSKKVFLKDPPVKARCVAIDFPNFVEKVIGPEYVKWATAEQLKDVAYANDKRRKITWSNGSQVEFMTYEQPVLSHGGAALDAIHYDEEPTEGHWQQGLMRIVSTRGRMLVGMTAEQGVTWTEDVIWEPGLAGDSKKIYAIEMSTYENPMNTPEQVLAIEESCLSQVEVDIRIHGKRKPRGGSIFSMYKEDDPWIQEPFKIPKESGVLICSIDPHPQTPHAVVWVWLDNSGEKFDLVEGKAHLFCCAELFEKGHGGLLASYIRIKENELGRTHDVCLCDPAGWVTRQDEQHSKSIVDQLNEKRIFPLKGSKDLSGGIIKMSEMLSLVVGMKKKSDSVKKYEEVLRDRPQLMIMSHLDRLKYEMKNYRWQAPPRTRTGEGRTPKQKPVDKDDHLVEALRRICEFVYDTNFKIIDNSYKNYPILRYDGKIADIKYHQRSNIIKIDQNF